MIKETQEFSLKEQLDFIEVQVSQKEEIAKVFHTLDGAVKQEVEREVVLMKAVRDTLRLEYEIEKQALKEVIYVNAD